MKGGWRTWSSGSPCRIRGHHDSSGLVGSSFATANAAQDQVIPLMSEQLEVSTRTVETGTVRLSKHTEERTETLDIPLTRVQWQVEHVPVNRVVGEKPDIRQEGETTVYPVVEERLVVLRELVLLEEVRVTRIASTKQDTSSYVLRRETLAEERFAGDQDNSTS